MQNLSKLAAINPLHNKYPEKTYPCYTKDRYPRDFLNYKEAPNALPSQPSQNKTPIKMTNIFHKHAKSKKEKEKSHSSIISSYSHFFSSRLPAPPSSDLYPSLCLTLILSQINNIKPHLSHFPHMPRPQSISIHKLLPMRVKQSLIPTIHDRLHPWRICKPKHSPPIRISISS